MATDLCPACGATDMVVTVRHARGCNTTGAAGGRIESVHGYVVRARCQRPACGTDWERSDYDVTWQRSRGETRARSR